MTRKRWAVPLVAVVIGAALTYAGVGGYLAVIMNAGQPNPPPPGVSGLHALLWALCAVAGGIGVLFGVIRLLVLLLRTSRGGH